MSSELTLAFLILSTSLILHSLATPVKKLPVDDTVIIKAPLNLPRLGEEVVNVSTEAHRNSSINKSVRDEVIGVSYDARFFLSQNAYGHFDAREFCRNNGRKLLVMETQGKEADVLNFLYSQPTRGEVFYFWTSGSSLRTGSDFVWMSTSYPFEYENWLNGERPYDVTNRCVYLGIGNQPAWSVAPCSTQMKIICEK